MILLFLLSIGLLAQSCDGAASEQAIEAIEIGSSFRRVTIKSTGKARFFVDERAETQKTGSFTIEPGDFRKLVERLERYRSEARPVVQATEAFANSPCPKGAPVVTDSGIIFVHWSGPDYDSAFFADLGCDHLRNDRRNREILGIIVALPLPESNEFLP